jgi:hypothetical protein
MRILFMSSPTVVERHRSPVCASRTMPDHAMRPMASLCDADTLRERWRVRVRSKELLGHGKNFTPRDDAMRILQAITGAAPASRGA